jgi:inorganic pyrophosphatase
MLPSWSFLRLRTIGFSSLNVLSRLDVLAVFNVPHVPTASPRSVRPLLTSSSSNPSLIYRPFSSDISSSLLSLSPRLAIAVSSLDRTTLLTRHFSSTPLPTMSYAKAQSEYSIRRIGQPNTLEHRVFVERNGFPISPFHDIPLYANEQQTVLNMVVEIPRWTNAKQEVRSNPCPSSQG